MIILILLIHEYSLTSSFIYMKEVLQFLVKVVKKLLQFLSKMFCNRSCTSLGQIYP